MDFDMSWCKWREPNHVVHQLLSNMPCHLLRPNITCTGHGWVLREIKFMWYGTDKGINLADVNLCSCDQAWDDVPRTCLVLSLWWLTNMHPTCTDVKIEENQSTCNQIISNPLRYISMNFHFSWDLKVFWFQMGGHHAISFFTRRTS